MNCDSGIKEEVMTTIFQLAEQYRLHKVILFGSRARGDYHRVSDIDLAVAGGDTVRFAVDIEEQAPTLLKFDVVDLDGTVQKELRESIEKEGVPIYEKV